MSSEPKRSVTTRLVGMALVGAVCGALIYSLAAPKESCPTPPVGIPPTAYFDRANMEAITRAFGSWGGRFYLATREDGSVSVLAGPIKDSGEHIPYTSNTLQFHLFRALAGARTDMTSMDEATSELAVTAASTTMKPT